MELELVERVFFRLVLADTDEKFQTELNNFLPPVLLKIATKDEVVKNKVLELLTHVNKRLKSRPNIELPLETLLVQYLDRDVPSSVKNFTFIYIKMGYQRCSLETKLQFIPNMFKCMIGKTSSHQNQMLASVLFNLNSLVYPEGVDEKKKLFPFLQDSTTTTFVLEYFLDFLLLPYDMNLDMKDSTILPPPSFSRNSFSRIQTEPKMTKEEIESAKLAILKFLSVDLVEADTIIPHFIVASGDAKHTVAGKGENGIKNFSSANSWDNKKILNKLLHLYQGTVQKPGDISATFSADNVKLTSSIRLKIKIFPFILKSRIIADVNPALCLQIIFEGLFGDKTNQKLKQYSLDFIHQITLTGTKKTLSFMTPLFYQALSRVAFNKTEDSKLRINALNGFAKISKSTPGAIKRDVGIVDKLFSILVQESSEVQSTALNIFPSVAKCFETASGQDLSVLETIMLNNCKSTVWQVRLGASRLAQYGFSTMHLPSRYALILLSADRQEQVKEESLRTLFPTSGNFPAYEDVCYYICEKFQQINSQDPLSICQALRFIKRCLFQNCQIKDDDSNELTVSKIQDFLFKINEIAVENLEQCFAGKHVNLLKNAISSSSLDFPTYGFALENLILLLTSNEYLSTIFDSSDDHTISKMLHSPNDDVRKSSGQLLSILFAVRRPLQYNVIKNLFEQIKSTDEHEPYKDGKIYCIGFTLSRYCELLQSGKVQLNTDESAMMTLTKEIISLLCSLLKHASATNFVITSCCVSIYNICRYVKFLSPEDSKESAEQIIDLLVGLFKKATNIKMKEKIAHALTSLCIGDPEFILRDKIIEVFFQSSKIKEVELQFAIGECLSCIGAGQSSKVFKQYYNIELGLKIPKADVMVSLIQKMTKETVQSPLASIRQAGIIWLLSMVQFSGSHPVLKQEIKQIQKAFMKCLCDSDEITQDVASRGLSLIYETTSEENKQELMDYLMNSLMQGNQQKQKIEGDTKIFEEDALGVSPDGSKLSTYKELCSLATSMNKPDLIYKFMSLANHNAVWNSKKGAAFGIKAIAEIAGEEIKPLIGLVIPKLYRYQYDPNSSLKRSMASIWSVIVKDEKKAIMDHWKEILNELLSNMTNSLWRTRESCCLALKDLMKDIPELDLIAYFVQIWTIVFKVMDDVKESVRKGANALVVALSNLSVKFCESQNTKIAEEALRNVLDVILTIGITSRVDEVKSISLKTLVKITKSGGKLLGGYASLIIPTMLESLSGLEPQAFNTLRMQLSNENDVQEKLDILRVSSTNSSPMMEAVNLCLANVDENNLGDLVPKLCQLLKSGLGLSTKVGTATVISSLALLCQQKLQPFTGKILASLLNGVKNANAGVIKQAYSSAIGSVIKYAQETTVEKVIAKIKAWYFDSEDNNMNDTCALCISSMVKNSPEMFNNYGNMIVPFVLVAMQAEDNLKSDEKKPWTDMWEDLPSGNKASMKLYLMEINELVKECYESKLWMIRTNATKAINKIACSIGSSIQPVYAVSLLTLVLSNLSGRTWTGKETLLDAIKNLCIKAKDGIQSHDASLMEKVISEMVVQCNKSKLSYKLHAIDCSTEIFEHWEVDILERFIPILDQLLSMEDSDNDEDNDKDNREKKKNSDHEVNKVCCVVSSFGRLWPTDSKQQETTWEIIFERIKSYFSHNNRKVVEALIDANIKIIGRTDFENICSKINAGGDGMRLQLLRDFVTSLVPLTLDVINNSAIPLNLKTKAVKCLHIILQKTKGFHNVFDDKLNDFTGSISSSIQKLQDKHPDLDLFIEQINKMLVEK